MNDAAGRQSDVSIRRGPLNGVRVLDLTWMIAGPNCTRLLGDQGAEVIKIESERSMDPGRMAGPWRNGVNTAPDGAGGFSHFNRNKLGATLNLKHPRGRELFLELARKSDVIVDNYSAGAMHRLGLGYEVLSAVNPRLVMAELSGMGQTGPYSGYVAFGMTLMAMVGGYELTGEADGPPLMPGYTLADWAAATMGAFAITAALRWRETSGAGQYLDLGQFQMTASLYSEYQVEARVNGTSRSRKGNTPSGALFQDVFRCAGDDAWCAIVIHDAEEWATFRHVKGLADLPALAPEADMPTTHALRSKVEGWTGRHTSTEVANELQRVGLDACPVESPRDLVDDDPHLRERGFFQTIQDSFGEELEVDGVPFIMSEASRDIRRAGPLYGGDNDYVFGEVLGLAAGEIAHLRTAGVIA